ncbi:MAG: single-stranded-DNA-specific exonuclease RecJ [Phycisphaerales bacterium]|nr:single-stranded-DNA-specific exonuclease RecJ [Phycisphaerales bacterium]
MLPTTQGWTRRWLPVRTDGGGAGPATPASATGPGARPAGRAGDRGDAAASGTTLVERVLAARGLVDPDAIATFLHPTLQQLHAPELLPGMGAAVDRLERAVRQRERIVVYGDYDVDGVTATAVLFHALKAADPEARIGCYVPHRIDEGYGLNAEALLQVRGDGAQLVVTVDCGITARAEAEVARQAGLDLIITDHHQPPQEEANLPNACAIVHPALSGGAYPFRELCGAGVAFKLAWAFAKRWCGSERVSKSFQDTLMRLLPLVALGTVADVVPLVGENRVLAATGLRLMGSTDLVGLRALVDSTRSERRPNADIDSEKVGFVLGPRLNAVGRLGHAAEAVRLFTEASAPEAAEIARRMATLNAERQRTEREIVEQACAQVEAMGMADDACRAIVLADERWHPGVIGIVCSRLVERFGRPTVLLQQQGDTCKGSARAIDGFDLYDALAACGSLLTTFGGHAAAAGLALPTAGLEAFRDAFVAVANARIATEQLVPALRFDCAASLAEFDLDTVLALQRLAPFGRSNPRPSILVRHVRVAGRPKLLSGGQHLKVLLEPPPGLPGGVIEAVWWNGGEHEPRLARGVPLDCIVQPRISRWTGRPTVELEIKDAVAVGQGSSEPHRAIAAGMAN